MSTAGIATQTLIQVATERSMRGRVMGLYGLIYRGSPSLGALWAGMAASHFGFRWPVLAGALLVMVVCAWTFTGLERMIAIPGNARPRRGCVSPTCHASSSAGYAWHCSGASDSVTAVPRASGEFDRSLCLDLQRAGADRVVEAVAEKGGGFNDAGKTRCACGGRCR